MNADLDLDIADPDQVAAAVAPSLRDSDAVRFDIDPGATLGITVAADRIGALRGGVNTALMLTRLAAKFQRGDTR
ncbi:MAG: KEOPS complex subunit Pcc1 [Candidatus Nanohaloarchaea archaeon]